MRAWIEHGFKLLKSDGWQWQRTQMTDPERVERLWLVLAVATRYVLALGGEVEDGTVVVETIPELPPLAAKSPTTSRRSHPTGPGHPREERGGADKPSQRHPVPERKARGRHRRKIGCRERRLGSSASFVRVNDARRLDDRGPKVAGPRMAAGGLAGASEPEQRSS